MSLTWEVLMRQPESIQAVQEAVCLGSVALPLCACSAEVLGTLSCC